MQSSSFAGPAALDALALLAAPLVVALVVPSEPARDVLDVPRPGTTVTLDPSGIVVVPVNPFCPMVTLLDMPVDGGAVLRAGSDLRSGAVWVDGRDVALADAALDEAPVTALQGLLP